MSGDGPSTPRELVIEAAGRAAELIATPDVTAAWDQPSALDGMTVGALAAHLVRATGATLAYLDRTDPDQQPDDLLTKVTYFRAALEAPIHDRIKEVSAREATIGPAELAHQAAKVAEDLAGRLPLEPPDRLIGALDGRMLSLDDFCRTRLIETVMHLDDLAHSVGVETPPVSGEATAEIVDILVGIACDRHGDWDVIRALGRAERSSADVFPVF